MPYEGFINLAVTLLLGWLGYRKYARDRNNDERERKEVREKTIERDTTRHVENKTKMDTLLEFQRQQLMLNQQRDQQINELKQQTAELKVQTQMQVKGLERIVDTVNRRLERIEDRPQ